MTRCLVAVAAGLVLAVGPCVPEAAAQQEAPRFYLRGSAGYDGSRHAALLDRSCDVEPLLLYFGCQAGLDRQRLGAYGDFGRSPVAEIALGARVLPALRVELALSHRPGFSLGANANFLASGARQPVSADLVQSAAMARVFLERGPLFTMGRVEPFFGIGLGLSRNRIGGAAYTFPELTSNPATTVTPGGTHLNVAWDFTPGTAVRIAARTLLEVSYRYSDVGRVTTDDGPIEVVRGTRTLHIENVAGTRARLRSYGLYFGWRQEF